MKLSSNIKLAILVAVIVPALLLGLSACFEAGLITAHSDSVERGAISDFSGCYQSEDKAHENKATLELKNLSYRLVSSNNFGVKEENTGSMGYRHKEMRLRFIPVRIEIDNSGKLSTFQLGSQTLPDENSKLYFKLLKESGSIFASLPAVAYIVSDQTGAYIAYERDQGINEYAVNGWGVFKKTKCNL